MGLTMLMEQVVRVGRTRQVAAERADVHVSAVGFAEMRRRPLDGRGDESPARVHRNLQGNGRPLRAVQDSHHLRQIRSGIYVNYINKT